MALLNDGRKNKLYIKIIKNKSHKNSFFNISSGIEVIFRIFVQFPSILIITNIILLLLISVTILIVTVRIRVVAVVVVVVSVTIRISSMKIAVRVKIAKYVVA